MRWLWQTTVNLVYPLPSLPQIARQAQRFADELECGGVFINGYSASDARVAFGGVKKSGFGRELSHFGLREFCNVQTVWKDRR
jgi:succinate-semialdehyde dehydrogenase